MGKEHLPEFFIQFLLSIADFRRHVAQAQPLELLGPDFLCLHRNQRRPALFNRVAHLFGEAVTIAGGTCRTVRNPASSNDTDVSFHLSAIRQQNFAEPAILRLYLPDFLPQKYLYAETVEFLLQSPNHIRRMVGFREYSSSPLYFCLNTQFFKKRNGVPIGKTVETAVKKSGISNYGFKQNVNVTGIRQITSALARNEQFFPQLFIFFIETHLMAISGCCCRRQHSGGASSDHQYFFHAFGSFSFGSCLSFSPF